MSKFKIHVQHISYGWCGLELVIGDKLIKCNAGYSGPNPLASLIEICLDFLTSQKEGYENKGYIEETRTTWQEEPGDITLELKLSKNNKVLMDIIKRDDDENVLEEWHEVDPYYEIKVAYLDGKKIEWYNVFKDCWCPIDNDTNFILAINEQNKLRIAKNDTKYWVIATYSQFVDIENYKVFGPCYHVEEQQDSYSRSNPPLARDFDSYEAAQEWLKKYLQDRKIYKHAANLIKTFIGQLEIFRSHLENNEQIPRDEFEACFESFSLSLNGDVNNQLIFKDKENKEK